MPRTPRLDVPGARHHVMNRTPQERRVFVDEGDLALFLDGLRELSHRFGVRVHGYALMSNHFHLMVEDPAGNLGRAMQHFTSVLARQMNAVHGWSGPLFRGRYRNRLVMDEEYWRNLLIYVHNNPAAAGLSRSDEPAWTSHRAYLDQTARPGWLQTDELLEIFGGPKTYLAEFEEVVSRKRVLPPAFDEDRIWRPAPTSTERLVVRGAIAPPMGVNDAIAQVVAMTGLDIEELRTRRVGRTGNHARGLAAWWALSCTGATREMIGEALEMSAGAVAIAAFRVRHATVNDEPELAAWRDALNMQRWGEDPPPKWPPGVGRERTPLRKG